MKIDWENKGAPNPLITRDRLPDDKLANKCREFEGVFVQKMLEVCQPKSSLFGSGMQGDFYRSFYIEELAKEMTKNPGLGLAESLYRALQGEQGNEQEK